MEYGEIPPSEKKYSIGSDLKQAIQVAVDDALGLSKSITDADWEQLGSVLDEYCSKVEYWQGFLKKGDVALMSKVRVKAGKLLSDIEKIKKQNLVWVLEQEEISSSELTRICGVLQKLNAIDPRSPYTKKSLSKEITDQLAMARGELQKQLDSWWKCITGGSMNVGPPLNEEDEVLVMGPYELFFEAILEDKEILKKLGPSHTAIHTRRSEATRAIERETARARKYVELAVWFKRQSGRDD